jgi:DNA-binding response OmpR family regulator
LIVEDEKRLALSLAKGLTAEGFAVDVVHDGLEGLHRAAEGSYDLVILDIMLPGMNGYRVCGALRSAGHDVPILMLTAKDGEYDEAEGLDTGADDYLTKPFSYVVLVARVKALLRRRGVAGGSPKSPSPPRSSPYLSSSWCGPVRWCPRPRSWSTSGTSRTRGTRTSSRSTSARCAASSGPS